ncbi:hypothetical protein OJ996_02115 [Luteolibacter sp. GHJ8]|uniref:Uncharacterized protein n=1 Tax=Luteolibacter rhizosphaerae TaxID=2989719 RepID=A0ABT3FZF5_9BACT|nr:hypothetical protein [Luteolibacter rhizosphaerae]MCW1912350.1 hypothetical protein [Luteolibacter rhizosphaerae]
MARFRITICCLALLGCLVASVFPKSRKEVRLAAPDGTTVEMQYRAGLESLPLRIEWCLTRLSFVKDGRVATFETSPDKHPVMEIRPRVILTSDGELLVRDGEGAEAWWIVVSRDFSQAEVYDNTSSEPVDLLSGAR